MSDEAILASLAVAFAAFCIWLTIRIINRRERWVKQLAGKLAVAFVVYYPLSIGLGFWFMTCGWLPRWAAKGIAYFYGPIIFAGKFRPIGDLVDWYISLWLD